MKKLMFLLLFAGTTLNAQTPTISDKTEGLTPTNGFFTYYFDEDAGKMWLEVDKLNEEFLYVHYLAAGVGSNDIGLDRSQQGGDKVVYFEKRGSKLLLIQPNLSYIARSDNELEKKSVREAFATSVLYGFDIAAREGNRYLVDLTPFLLQDAHGITTRLQRMGEGNYRLDASRSVLYAEGTFNFPMNTEMETMLTFAGSNPGREVQSVVPSPEAITVRQHHSFVQLPDDNYEPRTYDPRAGFYPTSFMDYAAPIDEPMTIRFINRHRLEKKDPSAAVSEPVEPIVYYLDNGTPEPVRSALLDGARWWNQAFEAAGYKDAFQVKILPDDAHPLDIRYNVINWVHRSTRGWSYGGSIVDPRTGEIIKGNVLLGSLRVRQDYMIATGLLAPFEEGAEDDPRMMEMALARIRQLSAHEVGHTLGIYHNFASSINDRASVMDYPHPKVDIVDGKLDLSDAYDTGIGEWDKVTIAYGYQDFPEEVDEAKALDEILDNAYARGLHYISDSDARPVSGAHPLAHLWDYGTDVSEQLEHILEVRRIALENFGQANIPMGTPMTKLEDVLVPIYLFHRYQVEATSKMIGGVYYNYKLRGDDQPNLRIVEESMQRKALDQMLMALDPEVLALPESVLELIPPRPAGMSGSRELFRGNTGPILDALGIARTAASVPLSLILNPDRANRLVEFGARDNNLSLDETITMFMDDLLKKPEKDPYLSAIRQVTVHEFGLQLMMLHHSGRAHPVTKNVVLNKLKELRQQVSARQEYAQLVFEIDHYLTDPEGYDMPQPLSAPPGSPIGTDMSCEL